MRISDVLSPPLAAHLAATHPQPDRSALAGALRGEEDRVQRTAA